MNVTVFSTQPYDQELFSKVNANYHFELTFTDTALEPMTATLAQGSDAVCVFVNDVLNAEVIQELSRLGVKFIALRAAGFNNVDLEAASRLGLRVVRVPAYGPEAVAEHAMAMLLTLNRKTHKAYNRVREGNFSLVGLVGFNLFRKTMGIIGLGKIGLAFARIANGCGCRILAFDPVVEKAPDYIELTSKEEVFRQSDILSLHCPLLPSTRHIINASSIAQMKAGVFLINTSRGGLLNTKDAIEALKSRHIGALAIDVYEQEEKLFFRDLSDQVIGDDDILRLMSFPNVLITAHQGFFTSEALTEIATTTFNNLVELKEKGSSQNEVRI